MSSTAHFFLCLSLRSYGADCVLLSASRSLTKRIAIAVLPKQSADRSSPLLSSRQTKLRVGGSGLVRSRPLALMPHRPGPEIGEC